MTCYRCKTPIKTVPNLKYCDICKPIVKAEQNAAHKEQIDANRKDRSTRAEISKHRERVVLSPISDVEQKALNLAIDNKYAAPTTTKIYTRAEIDAVAAQITHPKYIRRGCSAAVTYIDAEPSGRIRVRHPESVNEL